jgi:hypothetical protein
MAEQKLCTVCGTVGDTKRNMKGSILTELVLWLFFLLPGLIYTIWRHSTVAQVCRKCGSAAVIPVNSPVAQQTLAGRGMNVEQVQAQMSTRGVATTGKLLVGLVVAGIVFLVLIIAVSTSTPTNTTPTHLNTPNRPASNTASGKTLPVLDHSYVRVSIQYLGSANADGKQLATVWAGASDGTSTLDDCRAAARKALAEEKTRYSTYRAARGTVPPAFANVDRHIGEIHIKTIAGLSSVLSYWTNGDLNSISRGMEQYQAAILETNSTIAEGTAVTKAEAR